MKIRNQNRVKLFSTLVLMAFLLLMTAICVQAQPAMGPDSGDAAGSGFRGGPPAGVDPLADFDADGDGRLSRDEFPGPDEHFEEFDLDGDGYLSKDEQAQMPPPPPPSSQGFIADFDKDNDGKVSQEEFPGPDEHFARLDRNEDGFVDQSEAPRGGPGRNRRHSEI